MDLRGYAPNSIESRRYSKPIEAASRRALTSQPGKRNKNRRLTSASSKSKYRGKSDKGLVDDHPYSSALENTHQNIVAEDDTNMINIKTHENLNKTGGGKIL